MDYIQAGMQQPPLPIPQTLPQLPVNTKSSPSLLYKEPDYNIPYKTANNLLPTSAPTTEPLFDHEENFANRITMYQKSTTPYPGYPPVAGNYNYNDPNTGGNTLYGHRTATSITSVPPNSVNGNNHIINNPSQPTTSFYHPQHHLLSHHVQPRSTVINNSFPSTDPSRFDLNISSNSGPLPGGQGEEVNSSPASLSQPILDTSNSSMYSSIQGVPTLPQTPFIPTPSIFIEPQVDPLPTSFNDKRRSPPPQSEAPSDNQSSLDLNSATESEHFDEKSNSEQENFTAKNKKQNPKKSNQKATRKVSEKEETLTKKTRKRKPEIKTVEKESPPNKKAKGNQSAGPVDPIIAETLVKLNFANQTKSRSSPTALPSQIKVKPSRTSTKPTEKSKTTASAKIKNESTKKMAGKTSGKSTESEKKKGKETSSSETGKKSPGVRPGRRILESDEEESNDNRNSEMETSNDKNSQKKKTGEGDSAENSQSKRNSKSKTEKPSPRSNPRRKATGTVLLNSEEKKLLKGSEKSTETKKTQQGQGGRKKVERKSTGNEKSESKKEEMKLTPRGGRKTPEKKQEKSETTKKVGRGKKSETEEENSKSKTTTSKGKATATKRGGGRAKKQQEKEEKKKKEESSSSSSSEEEEEESKSKTRKKENKKPAKTQKKRGKTNSEDSEESGDDKNFIPEQQVRKGRSKVLTKKKQPTRKTKK